MNKHKKFIKDCYNGKHGSICSEWKQTILNHYPEFQTQLKEGRWYKANYDSKYLIFAEKTKGDLVIEGYGFDDAGKWFDVAKDCCLTHTTQATEQEVFEALKNEAVKRGFKAGVFYDATNMGYSEQGYCEILNGRFDFIDNILTIGNWEIFKNGKWAEIVSKKKMTLKEVEKELGYEIEITE